MFDVFPKESLREIVKYSKLRRMQEVCDHVVTR